MKKQGRGFSLAAMSLRLLCPIHFQAILLLFIALLHVKIPTIFAGSSTSTFSYFGGNETDHQALLAFKKKITHGPENILSSRNDSLHFCEWEGITCGHKHRRVIVLDMRSRGSIPKELASLSKLEFLLVRNNNLTGEIPSYIGNFSSFQILSAAHNVLGGYIPDALGQLRSLDTLGLMGNELSGLVPPSLYNLSSIVILSFARNDLSGSLPADLFLTLPHLQWLQIYENKFTGPLPVSLSNASELSII
ncbi:probable LRR receptor-like serine/threonine-protein kinase At3g47570 [Quercus robur]|uniref:probable LRR receptor-like serine/threonine-protein kinase At3g47570 n=1 Tax=Quercus robur TaxID=38942 RepID=UPI00216262CD|nr:probable LRR receptor-like serine/threonine-protein kinase At3g47570 [Quercus robur]